MKTCKTTGLFLLILATSTITPLFAQTSYWDTNDVTVGAGGATPTGTWSGVDNFWSSSSAGTAATAAWTPGNTAVFAAGTDASGTYTVNVSGIQAVGGVTLEEGTVTLSGGTLDFSGGNTLAVTNTLTIGSTITGTLGLIKVGAGTLALSSANTFSGNFTINGGDVNFGNNLAASSGTIIITPNQNVNLIPTGNRTLANDIVLNIGNAARNTQVNNGVSDITLSGVISGAKQLRKGASQKLTLSGDNTWTGGLNLRGGSVALGHKNALGTGTFVIDTNPGSVVQAATALTGASAVTNPVTVGVDFAIAGAANLELSGPVCLGAATRTLTVTNTGSTILSGIISGNAGVGLTKAGNGALTLSGANTYTGPTVVNVGTLLVNGSLASASAVSVASGATLGGSGVMGSVSVAGGGTLAPGNSAGVITVSSLTLSPGATLAVELNGLTAGSLYDQVVSSGNVTLTDSLLSISLGFDPSLGNTFLIVTNSGSTFGTFSSLAEGAQIYGIVNTNSGNIFSFEISYLAGDGNDVRLTVIPEPQAWGIAAGGLAMLALARRIRRQSRLMPVRVPRARSKN